MNLMRSNCWLSRGLGTGLLWVCLACFAYAQPANGLDSAPGSDESHSTESSSLEAEPSIYMLPDENGELQAVLNFRLEDFEALLDLQRKQAMATEPPEFTLSLEADGKANEESAELAIQFEFATNSSEWTRIPLNFNEGALVDEPRYSGEGNFFLTRENDAEGFVAWIRTESREEQSIELVLRLPVSTVGGESRLRMTIPEVVFSKLKLVVNSKGVIGRVTDGSALESEETNDGEDTQFELLGLRNRFEMTWRTPASDEDRTAPTLLQSGGELLATIDGRTITTEALLRINSFGDRSFDSFRVRLPPGAHLVPGQRPGYTLVEVTPGDVDQDGAHREVSVQLDEPHSNEVEILLVAERPHDAANEPEPIELAGFDVVGAVRQTGFFAVEVLGDWQISWEGQRNVRRVEAVPESLNREALLAGFEYLGQPCSLTARISPRETVLGVDPEYLLEVSDDRIDLTAKLQYTIRGAKAFALDIDFDEWVIDEIGPHSKVDLKGVVLEKRSPLSIPLWLPLTGEHQFTIKAHRLLSDDESEIDVVIPRPRATSLGPARVEVAAAENIVLVPKPDLITGLTRNTAPATERWDSQGRRPLSYRGDSTPARFVADYRVEPGTTSVSSNALFGINRDGVSVIQSLDYDVRFESIEQVVLELPAELASSDLIDVTLDGQPLVQSNAIDDADGNSSRELVYDLGEPRLGEFRIQVRYAQAWEQLPRDASVSRIIPLVMPVGGTLALNEVLVDIDPGIELAPRSEDWIAKPYVSAEIASRRPIRFRCKTKTPKFELVLSLKDQRPYGGAFIDKLWIQSWIEGPWRNDRAVFCVSSPSDTLFVHLPSGAPTADAQVYVDGVRASLRITPEGQLAVSLPSGDSNADNIVELNYRVAVAADGWGRIALEPPRFEEPLWVRRTYWQLVLPDSQHLLTASGTFSPELKWTWNGMGWSRAPLAEQLELEDWVGASHAAAMPTGSNRYLFSTLGNPQLLETGTASRGALVFLIGGSVLVVSLLVYYVPAVRHLGVVMSFVAIVLAGAWLQPDLAFIALQIAALAAVFLVCGLLIQKWLRQRRLPQSASRHHGSSIVEMGSTDRQYHPPVPAHSSSSTHTQSVSAGSSSAGPEL